MAGHSRPPPSDPPDCGRYPDWMIGNDELQHTIALQMKVRSNDEATLEATETRENEPRLPSDPFVVGNAVLLVLGPANARKVTASKEAGGARYILRTNSKSISEKLQQITELPDGTPIVISPHPTLNVVQGVVYDVDTMNQSEEYILNNLKSQGVSAVRRIKKRQGETYLNTPLTVLSFQGSILPRHVYFGLLRVSVRAYYPSPLLCFRCANYGHSKKRCDDQRFPEVCLNCSKSHEKPVGNECANPAFCKNCQQDHTPISKICRVYRDEEAIIKAKVERGLSYGEARAELREANRSRSYANTVQDRLRNEESDKDKIIKMLQQEVESLRQVILELKAQMTSINNASNETPKPNTPTTSTQTQPCKHTAATTPAKVPSVALTRLDALEQRIKASRTDNQGQNPSSIPNQESEQNEEMEFEVVRNNKRKGNKNKGDPESPDRKKGNATNTKKK